MAFLESTISKIDNPFLRGIFVFLVFTCTAMPVAVGTYVLLPGSAEGVSVLIGTVMGYAAALAAYHAGMWGEENQQ